MATGLFPSSGQGANYLKSIFDSELPRNPTEESVMMDFCTEPIGSQMFGNLLTVRKIPTVAAQTLAASANGGAITDNPTTVAPVTLSPTASFGYVDIAQHELTRAVDSANVQEGYKSQILAGLREQGDTQIFTAAATFSQSETGADFDKTMFNSMMGKLAEFGKGRVVIGETTIRLVIHPREIKNVMATDVFNFAYIRGDGTSGAKDGLVRNAYGAQLRESGLVNVTGGVTANNIMVTKEALMLAWNQRPKMLDVQQFLLSLRFIAWQELAAGIMFDQFGGNLNTTI